MKHDGGFALALFGQARLVDCLQHISAFLLSFYQQNKRLETVAAFLSRPAKRWRPLKCARQQTFRCWRDEATRLSGLTATRPIFFFLHSYLLTSIWNKNDGLFYLKKSVGSSDIWHFWRFPSFFHWYLTKYSWNPLTVLSLWLRQMTWPTQLTLSEWTKDDFETGLNDWHWKRTLTWTWRWTDFQTDFDLTLWNDLVSGHLTWLTTTKTLTHLTYLTQFDSWNLTSWLTDWTTSKRRLDDTTRSERHPPLARFCFLGNETCPLLSVTCERKKNKYLWHYFSYGRIYSWFHFFHWAGIQIEH